MLRFVPSEAYQIDHPDHPGVWVRFRVMDTLEELKFGQENLNATLVERNLRQAKTQVEAWGGVGDKDGKDLPLTPENAIDVLYSDQFEVKAMTEPSPELAAKGVKPAPYRKKFYAYLTEEAKKRAIEAGKTSGPPQSA